MVRTAYRAVLVAVFVAHASLASAGALTLAWDRNPEPNVAGYRVYYGTQAGSLSSMVDAGNNTSWQVRDLVDGQRYYLAVSAYNTSGLESPLSTAVSGVVVGLAGLLSDISTPAPTGRPITWTALAGGGTLEYRFVRLSLQSGVWSEVQPYGPSNVFNWTPSPGQEGTYLLQVWARVQGSSEEYEAWRSTDPFTIANGPVFVGSIEADVALPSPTGMPITWTARAVGGPAPLQYRFVRFSQSTGIWTETQPYGPSNTYTWTPPAGSEGTYVVQAWVRGTGSTAAYDGWGSTGYFSVRNGPTQVAKIWANASFPVGTGTPITWKAVAAGGPGPLHYRFVRYSVAAGTWTEVQPYGVSDSYTWTPSSGQSGSYVLQVWVRRAGSSSAYEAWGSTGYFDVNNATPVITGLGATVGTPIGTGVPVTLWALATGGPGPLQFKYLLYNETRDTWTVLREYSTDRTFTWTPSGGAGETYRVQTWVRRSGSTAAYDTWSSTAPFAMADGPPAIGTFSSDLGLSVPAGTPITWTAKASGGPGELQYRFIRYNHATQTWTAMQEYSWDRSWSWVPQPGEQGTYTFQTWVRRTGSTAAWEAWTSSQTFQVQ